MRCFYKNNVGPNNDINNMQSYQRIHLLAALTYFACASNFVHGQDSKWTFDASAYGLAVGMSGDITVANVKNDLDVDFGDVLENLEFGFMGTARVGYGPWGFRAEGTYMGLGASKNGISADVDQWVAETTLSYRVCQYFEPFAGARYNNMAVEIRGNGPLGRFRTGSGTVDWFDPIVGANLALPLAKRLTLEMRGDIGGFGAGSDLTWQAFPYLNWRISKLMSMQLGYRWIFNDYEEGSGLDHFHYDVLTQGPQLGATIHF